MPSTDLRKGDIVIVTQGEMIPGDGKSLRALRPLTNRRLPASPPPSLKKPAAISARSPGTRVVSDTIRVRITSDPGESFIDRMISLVEGASRQKTPNEIALNTLLIVLTLIFLIVVVTLAPIAKYLGIELSVPVLISRWYVSSRPRSGIAVGDRDCRHGPGDAVQCAGDVGQGGGGAGDINTMILDKTGTITFGNRMASQLIAVGGESHASLSQWAGVSSLDETPEGRSVLELLKQEGLEADSSMTAEAEFIEFKAETRMSGMDLKDGRKVRKGAVDAVKAWVLSQGGSIPSDLTANADAIAIEGGTPLAVAVDNRIYGLIYLKDTVKPGMKERFDQRVGWASRRLCARATIRSPRDDCPKQASMIISPRASPRIRLL